MLRMLSALSVVVYLSCATLIGQDRRDFSGTWVMDMSRSEMAAQSVADAPRSPVILVITHSTNQVSVETQRDSQRDLVRYSFPDPQARREVVGTSGTSDKSGVQEAVAEWKDGRLETRAELRINGQAVTRKETRSLDLSGREMTVETELVVQHGYEGNLPPSNRTTVKDVYTRREP